MSIKFLNSGLSTSLQDQGRFGFGSCGVPQSGVMDEYSAKLTNLVAGNKKNSPLLEITRTGPKIEINASLRMAIGGCEVEAYLNDKRIGLFEAFTTEKGDLLTFKQITQGNFAYLGIYGGLEIENVLSSKSMYKDITEKSRFKDGDHIKMKSFKNPIPTAHAKVNFDLSRYQDQVISVYPGPEFKLLTEENQRQLASQLFTLTADCNRMAFTFKEKLAPQNNSIATVPVLPGTIQLTSGGKLIALMKDAQVTGGYPRILQISEDSMDVLAQKEPGKQIGFQLKEL